MIGQKNGPSPIVWGLIIGIGLIFLVSARACTPDSKAVLRSRFAESGATQVAQQAAGTPIIPLPAPIQSVGETAVAKLQGGQAVVPEAAVASDTTLRVNITSLQQVDGGLQVKGQVTNVGKQPLRVPLAAFRFTDQSGTVYASQGDAAATLPPGGSTNLDLTLPIKDPSSLQMVVEIADANVRLELKLL